MPDELETAPGTEEPKGGGAAADREPIGSGGQEGKPSASSGGDATARLFKEALAEAREDRRMFVESINRLLQPKQETRQPALTAEEVQARRQAFLDGDPYAELDKRDKTLGERLEQRVNQRFENFSINQMLNGHPEISKVGEETFLKRVAEIMDSYPALREHNAENVRVALDIYKSKYGQASRDTIAEPAGGKGGGTPAAKTQKVTMELLEDMQKRMYEGKKTSKDGLGWGERMMKDPDVVAAMRSIGVKV